MCTALVLPYGVKQAAKRQAKQCTALFCSKETGGATVIITRQGFTYSGLYHK
jgi:hypothetical protein